MPEWYAAARGTLSGYARTAVAVWRAGPLAALTMLTLTVASGFLPAGNFLASVRLVNAIAAAVGRRGWWTAVWPWLAVTAALQVAAVALEQVKNPFQAQVTENLETWIHEGITSRAQAAELPELQTASFQNRLARARAVSGADMVQIISDLAYATQFTCGALALGAVLLPVNPLLPLLPTLGGVLTWVGGSRFGAELYRYDRSRTLQARIRDGLAGLLTDRGAAKEVRLYAAAPSWLALWQRLSGEIVRERQTVQSRGFRAHLTIDGGRGLLYAGALALLLASVLQGGLTIGEYVAGAAALVQLEELWFSTATQLQYVEIAMLGLRGDLYAFLDSDAPAPAAPSAGRGPGVIELQDVSFAYPGEDTAAIAGITLRIPPGQRIGLVGANGVGKSTLARVLLGLYPPTAGEMHVGGRRLDAAGRADWRRRCGAVFQDFLQYQFTAGDNIRFGDLERPERVEWAAAAAEASGLIAALPEGYRTLLGPTFGGRDLSGGQWQRLATARGFMPTADGLVVLDEPTAALDPLAEMALYEKFARLTAGRTSVVISHRLASARQCDRILVLQEGRIVEDGTHEGLLRRGGVYADMYGKQAQWYL